MKTRLIDWLRTNRIEILLAGIYSLLYLFLWPVSNTTMDESAYLNYAWVYRHGTIFSSDVGISAVQSYGVGPEGSHILTLYPPGMPAALAAVSFLGWNFALGANLFVHLVTFFLLAALLRRMGVPGWLAFLYLLHPTAVIYSHTLMSDPLSGCLMLLTFLACIKRHFAVAGILAGVSVYIRTANGITAGLLALGLFLEALPVLRVGVRRGQWGVVLRALLPAITVSLCALPFIAGAWWFQKVIQEGGWAKYASEGLLTVKHFPTMFPRYLLMLGIIFPGMVLGPALYRGLNRVLLATLCYGYLLFYSCYYFQDSGGSALETFIIGQRFMLAVLPLFLLAYAETLNHFLGRFVATIPGRVAAVAVATILFAVSGFGLWKHEKYLKELETVRGMVQEHIPADAPLFCNVHIAKLLHPAWTGLRKYKIVGNYHDTRADVEDLTRSLDSVFAQGAKEAYVAIWSREYRAESANERAILDAVGDRYNNAFIMTEARGLGILKVTGKAIK